MDSENERDLDFRGIPGIPAERLIRGELEEASQEEPEDMGEVLDELDPDLDKYSLQEFRDLVDDETAYQYLAIWDGLSDEEKLEDALINFYDVEFDHPLEDEGRMYREIGQYLEGNTLAEAWKESDETRNAVESYIENMYLGFR